MGPSGRRARVAVAAGLIAGAVAVVSIAVASQAETPRRIQVLSAVPADATSTSASVAVANTSTSTAATAVTSTSSGASAAAPPVDGTYLGVEHFALFTGRCAFLDHHIVGAFSAPDGTTWTFHQDYCGTLQGDLWSGVGTFTLTAADGAAITGTVTETNIRVPSPGVPYTLVITGGTQRFAAATGSCRLDNHLHQVQFGLQDDYGSFTCNVAK